VTIYFKKLKEYCLVLCKFLVALFVCILSHKYIIPERCCGGDAYLYGRCMYNFQARKTLLTDVTYIVFNGTLSTVNDHTR